MNSNVTRSNESFADLLIALTGPLIWAAHFGLSYLTTILLCGGGAPDDSGFRAANGLLSFAGAAALIGFSIWQVAALARRRDACDDDVQFLPLVGAALALLSLVGLAWNAMPGFLFAACEASR